MKPTLVIMAAGMGSRYGGLKQIDPVGPSGEIMIDYAVYDAIRAGFGRVVFIIRRDIERPFREIVERHIARRIPVDYAMQALDQLPPGFQPPAHRTKPWGTGHAILTARERVQEPFVVINADDFYGRTAYEALAAALRGVNPTAPDYFLAGYRVGDTLSAHGAVSRGVCEVDAQGYLRRVVERTHIERRGDQIVAQAEGAEIALASDTPVSMNCWGFTPALFPQLEQSFVDFLAQQGRDPKAELAIPTIVDRLIAAGSATVRVVPASAQWLGMTYPEDRSIVRAGILKLIERGEYPASLWA